MQMENFWKKLISLAFGIWMGLTSALFSVVGASRLDLTWQPAFFFWLMTMLVVALMINITWRQSILLLFAFILASWAAFLVGMIFTGIYVLGSLLVTWALVVILRLHAYRLLLYASGVLGLSGLCFDLWVASTAGVPADQQGQIQARADMVLSAEPMVALVMWQTIMMTAITLQLYAERRYRQRLAAQAAAAGGASEP